jgi:hypothetical protein
MAVPLEEPSPVDLGEASEPFHLQLLHRALELGEVLLESNVWERGKRLGAEVRDHRSESLSGRYQRGERTVRSPTTVLATAVVARPSVDPLTAVIVCSSIFIEHAFDDTERECP